MHDKYYKGFMTNKMVGWYISPINLLRLPIHALQARGPCRHKACTWVCAMYPKHEWVAWRGHCTTGFLASLK